MIQVIEHFLEIFKDLSIFGCIFFFLEEIIAAIFYVVEFWGSSHLFSLEQSHNTSPRAVPVDYDMRE